MRRRAQFVRMTGHPRAVLGDGRRSYIVMTEQGQTGTGYSIRSGSHDNTAGSDCHLSRWRQATFSGALVSIDRHRLAQLQMATNISVLPVSLGPISEDLGAPSTATATALLVYSLFVAAFVMLGAKIGKLVGERRVFQASAVAHGAAMVLMAISTDAWLMNTAQAIAGVAAGALAPTLVVLIAARPSVFRVVEQAASQPISSRCLRWRYWGARRRRAPSSRSS